MSFLRSFVLYSIAVICGGGALYYLIPFLMTGPGAAHLPQNQPATYMHLFGYYAVIRPWLLLVATTVACLPGFFMTRDTTMRILVLTLPVWVPSLYVLFYIALVAE